MGCQLFFKVSGAQRDQKSQSHVSKQLVSSAFSIALQIFPSLDGVREVINFDSLRRRQDLPAVVQIPPNCEWIMQKKPVPNLLIQLLLPSSTSRNVVILGPCHSSPNSCMCVTTIGCFWFSAVFTVCFSAAFTAPTKSLARYDQVLQLGPFFYPNQVGHQGLWLHQPHARARIHHTAENGQFSMFYLMTCENVR